MRLYEDMQFSLEREVPASPSYQTVPCSPYLRREPVYCESPPPTVPDIDSKIHSMEQNNGKHSKFYILLNNASPLVSTGRVPSISPRTPKYRFDSTPKEQLVPSQSPFIKPATPSLAKTHNNCVQALQLFSDDESIFL